MEIVKYPAIFTRDGQGGWNVTFPDLPEANTHGKDASDAMSMAKLGVAITVNDKLGHFEKAPQPSTVAEVQKTHPGADVRLVTVDLQVY